MKRAVAPLLSGAAPAPPTDTLVLSNLAPAAPPQETPVSGPSSQSLGETSKDTALAATPSFFAQLLGRAKGVGLTAQDWVSGDAAKQVQAQKTVKAVLGLADQMHALTDQQLAGKTAELKQRLAAGASLDDIRDEAFAVAREGAHRATGLEAYPEQILGAAYAQQGSIVDMKTGEGKTLMEIMPVYLNALTGDGVHLITANEYLAARDCATLAPAFAKLGLSTGVISEGMDNASRVAANKADVTYGTAAEFGFQYLRDNLSDDPNQRVGRDLKKVYALVDEADKVLLDDANTPLIIADQKSQDFSPATTMAQVVKHLNIGADIRTDQKEHQAWLTDEGLERAEKMLGVDDLYDKKHDDWIGYLDAAVKAKGLYKEGVDYVKSDPQGGADGVTGGVTLIDQNTGRLLPGHRLEEGLQQAVEAAEGLDPGAGQKTLASITYPSYFAMYGKMAGMTGTGLAAKDEFSKVFNLPVQVVPTHKPVIRQDLPDELFPDSTSRDKAMVDDLAKLHATGRPVLLGTLSIERSEELAKTLSDRGIPFQLLNAKDPEKEAGIIAQAGRLGAVTIATDMAGRGTDIKLGGDADGLVGPQQDPDALKQMERTCQAEKVQVKALGGLAVLGSERHDDQRIDQQLIGRCGRQGDPGSSRFYLAATDNLFKINVDKIPKLAPGPTTGSEVDQLVHQAQGSASARMLESRSQSLQYDGEVDAQREAVYKMRREAVDGANLDDLLPDMTDRAVKFIADRDLGQVDSGATPGDIRKDVPFLLGHTSQDPVDPKKVPKKPEAFTSWMQAQIGPALEQKKAGLGSAYPEVLKQIYVQALDAEWSDQQDVLKDVQQDSGMEAFGSDSETRPMELYVQGAHDAYDQMMQRFAARVVHSLLSAHLQQPTPAAPQGPAPA